MKNRILSLLLAALMAIGALACAASAEEAPAINLYDTTLTVGDTTYAFPVSVADLAAMGVSIPDVTGLSEGQYYYDVPVDDGRNAFSVRVDRLSTTEDPLWATGVNLNSTKHAGQSVGGLVLGETTMKEVVDACGPDSNGRTYDYDYLTYYTFGDNFVWNLYFESADEGAKLTRLTMYNALAANYGAVDGSMAGAPEENLPDPATLPYDAFILDGKLYQKGATVQQLLDNGWVLPKGHEADTTVAARDGNTVKGDRMWLYNGASLVKVSAFNTTDAECTLADCAIDSIHADVCNGVSIVCADGLENGASRYEEVIAILGNPISTSDDASGFRVLQYNVLNSVNYSIGVNAGGDVAYITIDGLM